MEKQVQVALVRLEIAWRPNIGHRHLSPLDHSFMPGRQKILRATAPSRINRADARPPLYGGASFRN